MPFFRDRNLDDDEDQTGGVKLTSAGAQADSSGAVQDPARPQQTGSRFTNLDNYLKNNDAKGFGQQFGQKVQGSVDQAKGAIDTATGEVRNQIESAPHAPSQDQINSLIQNAGDKTTADDAKTYQGWTTAKYEGPHSIADNAGAQSRIEGGVNKANTEARLSGSEPGRFTLLDQYFGRPSYNFGERSLDNLLVQGGGGFNNAKQLQDQASQLGAYGQQQTQSVADAAAQRQAEIEKGRLAARSAIGLQDNGAVSGGAIGSFQDDLNARVKAANTQRSSDFQKFINSVSGANPYVDEAGLGLIGGLPEGHVYNLDLTGYANKGLDQTAANTATDSDYAKYLALSKLAGVDPTFLRSESRQSAGKTDPYATFDSQRFARDRDQAEAQYNYDKGQSVTDWNKYGDHWDLQPISPTQLQDYLEHGISSGPALEHALSDWKAKHGENRYLRGPGLPPAASVPKDPATIARPDPATVPTPEEQAYPYAGHEWDDPDNRSMYDWTDPKNPRLKSR